jgi:hypothetical protein
MRIGGILIVAALAAVPRPSLADEGDDGDDKAEKPSWSDVSAGALRLDRGDLAGMVWAVTATCSDGDELTRRQCRAVRAARARRFDGKVLVVPGDAAAFTVGAWDTKKKTAPLIVSGCVACVEPIVVDGGAYYVTSKQELPTFDGTIARAAEVHQTVKKFDRQDDLTAWRAEVVPRLRTELVVQLDLAGAAWKRDDRRGVGLTVSGFRVYDPCDASVISSSPPADKGELDRTACGDAVVEGEGDATPKKPRTAEPAEELTPAMIKDAMRPIRAAAQACFDTYGVAGDSKLHVTVKGDGSVIGVEVGGDFADTPTGTCLIKAVQAISFPKTKKTKQSFKYPIVLR